MISHSTSGMWAGLAASSWECNRQLQGLLTDPAQVGQACHCRLLATADLGHSGRLQQIKSPAAPNVARLSGRVSTLGGMHLLSVLGTSSCNPYSVSQLDCHCFMSHVTE